MLQVGKSVFGAAMALVLIGCGGGGGASSSPPSPTPTPTPAPTPTPDPTPTGSLSFTDVTAASGIEFVHGYVTRTNTDVEKFSGGVAAADYDLDGDVDLFMVRGDIGANQLYRNDGNLNFTEVAVEAGLAFTDPPAQNLRLSGPTFADMDGDGDHDLFIGGFDGDPSFIYQNNGDGTFSDVSEASGIRDMLAQNTNSAAFGDYDKDGDIDMFLSHWGVPRDVNNPGDTEHLWRNISDGNNIRFENVSVSSGISATIIRPVRGVLGENRDYTFSPTFVDIDSDGYPDILSVGDFNSTRVFYNNGDGTFEDRTQEDVIVDQSGMGSAVGDYDNDGDMDWFVSSIYDTSLYPTGNRFYRNNDGVFEDITESVGVKEGGWGWAACFLDAENDGDLDIFHVNGWTDQTVGSLFEFDSSPLFIFGDNGVAEDQADVARIFDTEQGRALVCADFDNDGDVDLFTIHRNNRNSAYLFENLTEGNNFLSVRLVGSGKNTEATGARIAVTSGGVTQTREIVIGSNFTSQNPTTQIFGMGANSVAQSVEITWPDGAQQSFENVNSNQFVEYQQP